MSGTQRGIYAHDKELERGSVLLSQIESRWSTSDGSDTRHMRPARLAPRGVHSVEMDEQHALARNEPSEVCDDTRGAPPACVLREVRIVGSAIAIVETHGVVDRESGVPQAQEILGEIFRDEAEHEEQDRALRHPCLGAIQPSMA
jgi:hypothetical protein